MSNILVVDDGALITSWLTEILLREGFDVEVVADEKQIAKVYEEKRHSLIVTHLRVPDGLEMVEEVLRLNPGAQILAIVGSELIPPESVLNVASVFGPVRTLRKPFSVDVFLQTVADQLSESGNQAE